MTYNAALYPIVRRRDPFTRIAMAELVAIGHFVAVPLTDLPKLDATVCERELTVSYVINEALVSLVPVVNFVMSEDAVWLLLNDDEDERNVRSRFE